MNADKLRTLPWRSAILIWYIAIAARIVSCMGNEEEKKSILLQYLIEHTHWFLRIPLKRRRPSRTVARNIPESGRFWAGDGPLALYQKPSHRGRRRRYWVSHSAVDSTDWRIGLSAFTSRVRAEFGLRMDGLSSGVQSKPMPAIT